MKNNNVLIVVALAVCFIVINIGTVVAFIAHPEADVVALMAPLLTNFVTLAGIVVAIVNGNKTAQQLERTDEKVDYLANGGTDAKIRAGIADVLRPDLLKPDATEQLTADRVHRASTPATRKTAAIATAETLLEPHLDE